MLIHFTILLHDYFIHLLFSYLFLLLFDDLASTVNGSNQKRTFMIPINLPAIAPRMKESFVLIANAN